MTSEHDVRRKSDQMTLLYAALLAKEHGVELCGCKTLRCKICLHCLDEHCLCGREKVKKTHKTPNVPYSVSNLVSYFLKGRVPLKDEKNSSNVSCEVCALSCAQKGLRCGLCCKMFHVECLKLDVNLLPERLWYCKTCIPEMTSLFYPSMNSVAVSLIERARVLQIVTGKAHKLPEKAQMYFVERYVRNMKVAPRTRMFVYKHRIKRS